MEWKQLDLIPLSSYEEEMREILGGLEEISRNQREVRVNLDFVDPETVVELVAAGFVVVPLPSVQKIKEVENERNFKSTF